MKALVFALLALVTTSCPGAPRFVYSPYKDLAIWRDKTSNVITFGHDGKPQPYIKDGKSLFGTQALTWAFATGECGAETWTGRSAQDVADANVSQFDEAGIGYIISTGGQGGVFTCASDEGMERFIARYASKHLIGFDFDIEAEQTEQQVASLIARIKTAQARHPALRMSFTIATFAASDGSNGSLNAQGEAILKAIRASGLQDYVINLMVMDFGDAKPANCVVRKGVCDMGASALQAVRNVHAKYGVPAKQIELTAMIGVNDVVANVFSIKDVEVLVKAVPKLGLAGLHFWSLDRDTPCKAAGALATCSTLEKVGSGEFARAFAKVRP
jgi:chitinase